MMSRTGRIEHAEARAWLAVAEPGSATAVVVDPPYAVGSPVRGREDGAAGSMFAPFGFMHRVLELTAQALKPGGIAIIFADWRRMYDMAEWACMTGLRPATCVAWVRTRPGTGGLLRASWDPVLVAARGVPDAIDRAAIRNVIETVDTDDVIYANYPVKRRHPYEKPWEVTHHILQRVGPPGLVLDPFSGSGSTRIAAEKLGLEFRGADIDPQWADAEVTPS
jgi:site-specific DNA-methyltransferase (adenine-specific)